MVCLRREVNVGVVLVVEHSALFVEHVAQVLLVALEEHLVAAYNLGILVYAVVKTFPEIDDVFHTISRKERIAIDVFRLLTNTVNTSCTLN